MAISKKRFSLIELLIVVAVIAILISLVQPALRNAIKNAQLVVCINNLHHVSTGFLLFGEDTKHLPPSFGGGGIAWAPLTREYLGSGESFVCPNTRFADGRDLYSKWDVQYGSGLPAQYGYDEDEIRVVTHWGEWIGVPQPKFPIAYGVNNNGTRTGKPTRGTGDVGNEAYISKMVNPSEFIMISDSYTNGVYDGFIDYRMAWGEKIDWGRHFYGAVIGWGDGHATLEDTLDYTRNNGLSSLATIEVIRKWNLGYDDGR